MPDQPNRSSVPGLQGRTLRALIIEDDPNDADLLIRELRRAGYELVTRRVQTAGDLTAALTEAEWDIVLSDYSMPSFGGPEAFALLRKMNLDLPFIIVSGTVGEDAAVESMRMGVHDFILKGRLHRLVGAIERELRDAQGRAQSRKIEEQLLVSERMASVGTLAAGVAHEINNPLSVVIGTLQIMNQDFEALTRAFDGPADEAARVKLVATATASFRRASADAEEAAERVRVIARDLRVFSHPDADRLVPVDIHKVLESSLRMAHNELGPRAKVVRRFGTVPDVEANEARLGQVFLNLLVNAAHAIAEGHPERNAITLTTSSAEEIVTVEISDTGSGIPPEVLPRIFDVFFTTKPVGIGTGLGLSICHQILTALGGRIEVTSRPGEGTTFRVLLRRSHTGSTAEIVLPPGLVASTSRRARVLVVEDEAALGRMLPRLLAPHDVTVVDRAADALARIEAGETYDTILCDLMMPEMTGMDFYDALLRQHPEVAARIVFMSGGVFTPAARAFMERVPNRRIDKPFDRESLRRLVDQSIGKASA
jgi:signal transduction histidine kinase